MLLEVIHPQFRLDLSNRKLSLVDENSWFNDRFFVKYSYPFNFEVTEDNASVFSSLSNLASVTVAKIYKVKVLVDGIANDGLLIIDGVLGNVASAKLSYGYEELPNWNKKLSEFDLEQTDVDGSFYAFAKTKIGLSYPSVNYNFPMVKVPEGTFTRDSEKWAFFEGYFNNYINGEFLVNEYDAENDIQTNRNIMQPMPYLLYVISKAFEDAGFGFAGDIIQDPELSKALLVMVSSYYNTTSEDNVNLVKKGNEYDSLEDSLVTNIPNGRYTGSYEFTEAGRYLISGSFYLRAIPAFAYGGINFKNNVLWESQFVTVTLDYTETFYNIDIVVDVYTEDVGELLEIISVQYPFLNLNGQITEDPIIYDLNISKIVSYNSANEIESTLLGASDIRLKSVVPDITFGDLFKAIRNFRNYGITTKDGIAYVNKISTELGNANKVNLEDLVSKKPKVQFFNGDSYLLKFRDVDNDVFNQEEIFVNIDGYVLSGYQKTEETKEIKIDLIPLPNSNHAGVITAELMIEDVSAVQIAMYDGLINGENKTLDPTRLGLLYSYINYYKSWFSFRLNTHSVEDSFRCTPEFARQFTAYTELYMHQGRYIPKVVTKNIISKNEVEIVYTAFRFNTLT